MRADKGFSGLPDVIEKMAIADSTNLVLEKPPEGKIRVTSKSWDDAKVILRDQVLEIRSVDGQIRVSRKHRFHDAGDPPVAPYDPYGPGEDDIVVGSADPAEAPFGDAVTRFMAGTETRFPAENA